MPSSRHDELTIHTSADPRFTTRAVVEAPSGLFLVDLGERPYSENEGVSYDETAFLAAITDAYREGRGKPVDSVDEAFR
ncbi:hypothetical protein [Deinococcus yavapaiensis]|uniref:Uncharacterized protein n=1 Tax=Deinococcus yavapaiensis KR-236 TaxID=694435 RepID=A0A318S8K5_9DEIO|nr:hypothetical protein [Deinococcus yavapaiensis]PYE54445.1 hypothetical protein DES52_10582 [Deinococcus yavapaiensis KR-236]